MTVYKVNKCLIAIILTLFLFSLASAKNLNGKEEESPARPGDIDYYDDSAEMYEIKDPQRDKQNKIEGEVIEVMGKDVKIELKTSGKIKKGDKVELIYLTKDSGMKVVIGEWRVKEVIANMVIAEVINAKSEPKAGLKAIIHKGKEKKESL